MNFNFGLKLWSTNKNYVNEAIRLYDEGIYQYIELFAVPNSYKEFIKVWKDLKIPYIIHAAHSMKGLNLAKRSFYENNIILAQEAFKFADDLDVKFVIFHPGLDGDIQETLYQLNKLIDQKVIDTKRTVIENKPYFAIIDNLICVGNSPEEIEFVIKNTGLGFCLDIGHAIYSANAKGIDPFDFLRQFNKLVPKIYHVADGDFNGLYDEHKNIGDGDFKLNKILSLLYQNSFITIETPKKFKDSLRDFVEDMNFIKKIN